MQPISDEGRRRRIGHRHFLAPSARTDDLPALVDGLVGLHSSDPATVFLSAAIRMQNPSIEAIEEALYERRSLIRHHGFRTTMWVMTPATAGAMHRSTTEKLASAQARRIAKFVESSGISDDGEAWIDRAKRRIVDALERRGTATTRDLGSDLPDVAVPLAFPGGQVSAHSRLMTLLGLDGAVVRTRPLGSWISSQYVWSTIDGWIEGGFDEVDVVEAAGIVVDRYLRCFGPATFTDLAWWTGWTKTLAQAALDAANAVQVDLESDVGYVADGDVETGESEPWVALLPGLDPTTMGWKERDWYLDPEHAELLFDRNGNAGPTVWADGRVVGGWAQRPDGDIAYRLLDPGAEDRRGDIDDEIERLQVIYGDVRHRVRFPAPIQSELLR